MILDTKQHLCVAPHPRHLVVSVYSNPRRVFLYHRPTLQLLLFLMLSNSKVSVSWDILRKCHLHRPLLQFSLCSEHFLFIQARMVILQMRGYEIGAVTHVDITIRVRDVTT
jgi:hypothetical protein